jgi:hypothetical protein
MQFTVQIPDEFAQRLNSAAGGDLSRHALELLVADGYRSGHLTRPELRRILDLETGDQIDGFLKTHGVYEECSLEELNQELETLRHLGI